MKDLSYLESLLVGHAFAELPDIGRASSESEKRVSKVWPKSDWNSCSLVLETESDGLIFREFLFKEDSTQSNATPVLYVFDDKAKTVRVYSDISFVGENRLAPLVDAANIKDNVVVEVISAMAANDIDKVMACFGEEPAFSHSNGETVVGIESVRREFTQMMGDKGLPFTLKTMAETDAAIAVECELQNSIPNAAVYTLDRLGFLAHVRTYM